MNKIYYQDKQNKYDKSLLVLPNGYGALHYASNLGFKLSHYARDIFIPILSGQNGNDGKLSINTARNDFSRFFSENEQELSSSINIICHCSALLYLAELKIESFWQRVNKLVVYSFLANPAQHYERFIKKSKKYGVSIELDEQNLDRFTDFSIYEENIPVDMEIIHPKTAMNRIRASKDDLERIQTLCNVHSVSEPEIGYDICNDAQEIEVNYIIENHYMNLLNG